MLTELHPPKKEPHRQLIEMKWRYEREFSVRLSQLGCCSAMQKSSGQSETEILSGGRGAEMKLGMKKIKNRNVSRMPCLKNFWCRTQNSKAWRQERGIGPFFFNDKNVKSSWKEYAESLWQLKKTESINHGHGRERIAGHRRFLKLGDWCLIRGTQDLKQARPENKLHMLHCGQNMKYMEPRQGTESRKRGSHT